MKKTLAILLGAALVLVITSVASAGFTASGQFVVKEVYNVTAGDFGNAGFSDSRIEFKLDGTYGNASGDIKFRLQDKIYTIDAGSATVYTIEPVIIRTANVRYKVSDALTIGSVYDVSGDVDFYSDPVYGDYANPFLNNGYEIDDAKYPWLKVDVTLGDFKAMILNNLYKDEVIELRAGGTFALDPITIGAAVMYDDGAFAIVPGVTYAISDALSVAGEVYYEDSGYYEIGLGGAYEADALEVSGAVYVDDAFAILFYDLQGSYDISDVCDIYGEYHSDDLITAGLNWKLDGSAGKVVINAEYAQNGGDDDTLTSKITIKF